MKRWWTGVVFLVFGAIALWVVWMLVVPWIYGKPNTPAAFGDMFGGISALFSGLALAFVVYAIFLQIKELEIQRKDLEETKRVFTEQNRLMAQQLETMKEALGLQMKKAESGSRPIFHWTGGGYNEDRVKLKYINQGAKITNVSVTTDPPLSVGGDLKGFVPTEGRGTLEISTRKGKLPVPITINISFIDALGQASEMKFLYQGGGKTPVEIP